MSDTKLDIERDKMAEYVQAMRFARQDYCEKTCEEHNEKCPYYDPEEECWDYDECFRDSGGWE